MKTVILQWKDSEEDLRTSCKDYGARLKRLPALTRSVAELLQTKGRMPVRCSDSLCTMAHNIAI